MATANGRKPPRSPAAGQTAAARADDSKRVAAPDAKPAAKARGKAGAKAVPHAKAGAAQPAARRQSAAAPRAGRGSAQVGADPVGARGSAQGAGAARAGAADAPAAKAGAARASAERPHAGGSGARGSGARGSGAAGSTPFGDGASAAFGSLLGQMPKLAIPPERLAALQQEYVERWQELLQTAGGQAAPRLADKRFSHESWRENNPFAWTAALYLLNADFMRKLAEAMEGDARGRDRVRFAVQQWVDMLSPANFLATNPEAQRKLVETRGESLKAGLQNLLGDIGKGRISQTDENAFEVGRNVATTPGSVVFQNELIQLIQYEPTTPTVGTRPLLMVPPSVNKFYIMDLQPDNSLVAHAISNGHTVFMLSWRNVGPEQGQLGWDDYIESGIFEAIRVVREITGADSINTLGFCVGGTILATALAALARRGERPVASMTLMTTLLDFAEPGVLGVFVDESAVAMKEKAIAAGGILPGSELATTFSFLRPNDLVWNYYVNNYLKGEQPPAFDLLYWNSDSTNLPGPMFCWFLRHMYLQNELRIPDRLVCAGEPIDLRRIELPSFVFGAREDHIVPWVAAYGGARLLAGNVRFVLGASGHIAGAINPASKNKRSYWLGPSPQLEPDDWLAQAEEKPGSWWNEWTRWLGAYQGPLKPAPRAVGSPDHPPIEPAPGSYVKTKAP
ncbi:class I poly(R)-hydroxyalkanoic acid synthase [Quisquiliibacterium transsilvanicum]